MNPAPFRFQTFNTQPGREPAPVAKVFMHIGKLIHLNLLKKGMTVTQFASALYCTRANVYKIFNKESIDTRMLERISTILEYNFFKDLSENMESCSPQKHEEQTMDKKEQ